MVAGQTLEDAKQEPSCPGKQGLLLANAHPLPPLILLQSLEKWGGTRKLRPCLAGFFSPGLDPILLSAEAKGWLLWALQVWRQGCAN